MPAKINLINQHFGNLKVIEETSKRKNKSVIWKCQCKCGNIEEFNTKELRSDGIIQCHQCGNNRQPNVNLKENIIGKKFNHLLVIRATEKRSGGKILYECQCDCGNKNFIYASKTDLENNHTTSCGCRKVKYKINDIINNRIILGYEKKEDSDRLYYKVKCLLCNREYTTLGYSLKKTISCGCQKSIGEYNIIQVLNEYNIKYQKEYIFPNTKFRFDFAIFDDNNQIIRLIEFDGEQHYENNVKQSGWNTFEKYENTLKNDLLKNNLAKQYNIPLVRIPYWERDNINYNLIMNDKYLIF